MLQAKFSCALLAMATTGLWGQDAVSLSKQIHQVPDPDGVYYPGPEVTAPRMLRTVLALYPDGRSGKDVEGMSVFAMVIDARGIPTHLQLLHSHGDAFDQFASAAVQHSVFEPGKLDGKPVPVWIDVRVVFHANRSAATPQVLVAERDLPPPNESQLEDKHHNPLLYTPPFLIHTVDADFADPFTAHPFVQVATLSVLVDAEGQPQQVRVVRGLGFGLDEKAEAAVWHYRFLPATKKGQRIADHREVMVSFANF